jgi:multiple sugar transport system ATP-binding protein
MASIQLQNIVKTFPNGASVLKGINLDIAHGQFVILVGGSGCGKSTLLNIIAGLETASSGDVVINGANVNDLPPKDRDIAMVFQSYALYPSMNVRENIAFGLSLRKMPIAEQNATIDTVANLLQITHLLDRKPAQLSGGQRQRVAMGRALARKPSLFLFDEPLSNLDAKLRVDMRSEIKLLHKRLGTTIVYVTHDQIEAMTLGDKIAVMQGGVVEQYDTPQTIYDAPANLYVAGFMGSPPMNLLKGELTGVLGVHAQRSFAVQMGAHSIELHGNTAGFADYVGKTVILGLRPEHMTDAARAAAGATQRITVPVRVAEPTGADTLVTVEFAAGAGPSADPDPNRDIGAQASLQTALARVHPQAYVPGQTHIELTLDTGKAVLFDAATQLRIASIP